MSPIESTGLARGSPHVSHSPYAARSGAQKADSLQGAATAPAAAPVETMRAIVQTQRSEQTRLEHQVPTRNQGTHSAQPVTPSNQTLTGANHAAPVKPMTAVLLHELRLQQELADVQEEMNNKRP